MENVSVTPMSLPSVFEAIFSEMRGRVVREATIMSNLVVRFASCGMCFGLFSRSASMVMIVGYCASCMPSSRPLVWPCRGLVFAMSACCFAIFRVLSVELSSITIISCGWFLRVCRIVRISFFMFSCSFHVVVTMEMPCKLFFRLFWVVWLEFEGVYEFVDGV